jgi:D-alanyl-D-alanine carboxypeptidase
MSGLARHTEHLTSALDDVLGRFLDAHPTVPGASVAVAAGEEVLARARGTADPATGEPLTPQHAVRIASSTKPYVAGTTLVLTGRGALALDTPVIEVVPAAVAELLRAHPHGREMTVDHLLQHTSGLVDHTAFDAFMGQVPGQHWTAIEQLRIGFGQPPLWAPGTRFSYSDTGYVLLGSVVEHVTGQPLHRAVRDAVGLDRLGLDATWWETFDDPPPGVARAHQFFEGTDTHDWDPSLDLYGGGGLVATPTDQARYWSALFAGRVHPHLDQQQAPLVPTAAPDGSPFGAGDAMGRGMFHVTIGGHELWGHGGFWGTREWFFPAAGVAVAVCATHRTAAVDLAPTLVAPVIDTVAGVLV